MEAIGVGGLKRGEDEGVQSTKTGSGGGYNGWLQVLNFGELVSREEL
jgi:hypothetical protein